MGENAGESSPTREQQLEERVKELEQRNQDLEQAQHKHDEDDRAYWELRHRAYQLFHVLPDKSLELYLQTREITPHPEAKKDCNFHIGVLYGKKGDYQKALEHLKNSWQDDEEIAMAIDEYETELAAQQAQGQPS